MKNIQHDARVSTLIYDIDLLLESKEAPLVAGAFLLAQALSAPVLEEFPGFVALKFNIHPTVREKAKHDPENLLLNTLNGIVEFVPSYQNALTIVLEQLSDSKWFSDYKDVLPLIVPEIVSTVENAEIAELALVELFLIRSLIENKSAFTYLVPWFVRHGELSKITNPILLNALASMHYKEYVARLPADELIEFLTSENENARTKAKNKVRMELIGDLNEVG